MYKIPEEHYYRIHHVRPRFKSDVENVLIYIAGELCRIGKLPREEFVEKINTSIRQFPGNIDRTQKTINNWRTEISSLFGLIIDDGVLCSPSLRAKELAQNEDLVEFFKKFLFTFQYPGGHIKSHEIADLIKHRIRFKPAHYLIRLLRFAESFNGKRCYVTKGEFCHCVFNDMRCTKEDENLRDTWNRIVDNRLNTKDYDLDGDVIRYAGDIIDYMEIANLLVSHDGQHYLLNPLENEALMLFENSSEWFDGYDKLITYDEDILLQINEQKQAWFSYVNRPIENTDFSTDILSFISSNEEEHQKLLDISNKLLDTRLDEVTSLSTKEIGDIGEGMVFAHEKQRIKEGGKEELLHLIKRIPTQLAIGYDIQSVELDERRRYIEVKTTISAKPLLFNRISLTSNEWRTAASVGDRFFIYRLMISKNESKLFILQNPVELYKNNLIEMLPKDTAEITFSEQKSGEYQELLTWQN